MLHPSWSGSLQLGNVRIRVKAYTAIDSKKNHISLSQLHAQCHSRIQQKRFCPLHGELHNDEIVKGFQHKTGQYVVFDQLDLGKLRPAAANTIAIDKFVPGRTINPILYSGKSYYLLAADRRAEQSYRALHHAMTDERVLGLAKAVICCTDRLMVVRPIRQFVTISVLHYAEAVRPAPMFDSNLAIGPNDHQMQMQFKSLIHARRADHPHLEDCRNPYNERLYALVAAKNGDEDLNTRAEAPEQPDVNKTANSSRVKSTSQLHIQK